MGSWLVGIAVLATIAALVLLMRWSDGWRPGRRLRDPAARRKPDALDVAFLEEPRKPVRIDVPERTIPSGSPPPSPMDENVQFTLLRPDALAPDVWSDLLVFMHLTERRPEEPETAPHPLEEVEKQAKAILGARADQYVSRREESRQAVPRSSRVTMLPFAEGVSFNPSEQSFQWQEAVHRVQFRMRASASLAGRTTCGGVRVFFGRVLLADISLVIRVTAEGETLPSPVPQRQATARRFRRIFASYSHHDTDVVEEIERCIRTVGDDYLRDVHALRAGEAWHEALLGLIEHADVFQLFWSHNAMASKNVEAEWRHALTLNRPDFIRPVYWELPMPSKPEEDLPPEELRRIHFHYLALQPGLPTTEHQGESESRKDPPPAHKETVHGFEMSRLVRGGVAGITLGIIIALLLSRPEPDILIALHMPTISSTAGSPSPFSPRDGGSDDAREVVAWGPPDAETFDGPRPVSPPVSSHECKERFIRACEEAIHREPPPSHHFYVKCRERTVECFTHGFNHCDCTEPEHVGIIIVEPYPPSISP